MHCTNRSSPMFFLKETHMKQVEQLLLGIFSALERIEKRINTLRRMMCVASDWLDYILKSKVAFLSEGQQSYLKFYYLSVLQQSSCIRYNTSPWE